MPRRKVPLSVDGIYHVYNRSIAEFTIFRHDVDYERMVNVMRFYLMKDPPCCFSQWEKTDKELMKSVELQSGKIVDILAYCVMPTHIHLILKEMPEDGIAEYLGLILNSYSKYFNLKYKRKGPLWEGRFKNVLIETDEQLIHTTRYIHLNPTTSFLVNDPAEWKYSSYKEYLELTKKDEGLCNFSEYLSIEKKSYAKFVNDQIGYQRELALIKNIILE